MPNPLFMGHIKIILKNKNPLKKIQKTPHKIQNFTHGFPLKKFKNCLREIFIKFGDIFVFLGIFLYFLGSFLHGGKTVGPFEYYLGFFVFFEEIF
jgi:hypothetical protein